MKIAQIVCAFPPYVGGIGQSAKRYGEILSSDHQVVTFTLAPQTETAISSDPVKYLKPLIRYGHGGLPFSLLNSLKEFDCLYLHYPFFGATEIIWLYLLFNKKTKLVIHYHMDTQNLAWYLKPLAWPSRLIRDRLFKRASTIISGSLDYIRNSQISEFYKKYPDKFQEIPFGLDTNLFSPKLPENNHGLIAKTKEIVNFVTKNFIKRGLVNLLFVGGLDSAHYFKGLSVLFEALTKLENKHWQLNIVGSGNLKSDYQRQAENLGLIKKIKFLGRLSDSELIKTYQDSDIFILPSINRHEAFGIVLTEAMACGLPVIASDLPGVRRVFRDRVDGLLAKTGDAQDLSKKIDTLINNENERLVMGKNARTYATATYSWNQVEDKLRKIFI
ncbi:MAG: glycosyltransferase family 4 protein [Candidatus Falkowbacteria bacterium]